jgi:hypothetical protein
MPRSGTTLIEQIICSHTRVTGAGELNFVSQFGEKLAYGQITASSATLRLFRAQYLAEVAKKAEGRQFIIDKMPVNFRYIALICAAFPEAKIIHVQRSAKATCWSNFKHYFVSNSYGYSYNLVDTVRYYSLYMELMQFWNRNYANCIYHLDYDTLTENQEAETRSLIDHLGLKWEDACLSPETNNRSVRTASQQQVRQKVYQGSSENWRKYEPYLDGAFDSLAS